METQTQHDEKELNELLYHKERIDAKYYKTLYRIELMDVLESSVFPVIEWENEAASRGIIKEENKREGKKIFKIDDVMSLMMWHTNNDEELETARKSIVRKMTYIATQEDMDEDKNLGICIKRIKKTVNKALKNYIEAKRIYNKYI